GYRIHRETWKLLASAPVITLGKRWPEIFPMLAAEPAAATSQQAWQAFAQERGLSANDAAACQATVAASVLHIQAPQRLADALRRLRSDSAKGQSWTLVGEGGTRKIVRVALELI